MPSNLTLEHFLTEEAAFAYVEAKLWPNGPVCPHCTESGRIGRLQGKSTRPGLRKCYNCRKPFTVRQGSIFESSHLPLRVWLQIIYMMNSSKKGISTQQIHRIIGGSMKTAWFLGMRIRECMKEDHLQLREPIGGEGRTVEVDTTYVGASVTNRASGKVLPKKAVMALVERDGKVRSFHVPNITANTLQPIIGRYVSTESRFISDEAQQFTGIAWQFADSGSVKHSEGEYVKEGGIFTNSVEGYFSVLKRGIYGIYQHVSEAHLQRYLSEFNFRHTHRMRLGFDDKARADLTLVGARGKRLTYRTVGGGRAAKSSGQTESRA